MFNAALGIHRRILKSNTSSVSSLSNMSIFCFFSSLDEVIVITARGNVYIDVIGSNLCLVWWTPTWKLNQTTALHLIRLGVWCSTRLPRKNLTLLTRKTIYSIPNMSMASYLKPRGRPQISTITCTSPPQLTHTSRSLINSYWPHPRKTSPRIS